MPDNVAVQMSRWQEEHLRGTRNLRPEDFSLDEASVRDQYRFYTDRFSAFM
jgi:hypothetical protein